MTTSRSHRQKLLSTLVFPLQTAAFFPFNKINKIGFFGKEICEVPDAEEICLTALASSAVTVLMVPAPLIVTKMNT